MKQLLEASHVMILFPLMLGSAPACGGGADGDEDGDALTDLQDPEAADVEALDPDSPEDDGPAEQALDFDADDPDETELPDCEPMTGGAPYPPSPVIECVAWAPPASIVRLAEGSDNWPMTWADDDDLYTAYGDGWGFDPRVPDKLSLGFAAVSGMPPTIAGTNIRSTTGEQTGDGASGMKASGMLMVEGVLFMLVRNAGNSVLAWSDDHAETWTWSDWRFTTSFGHPVFVNYGRNYQGARDGYVYIFSHDHDSAYEPADRMVLARAPADRIAEREAYEFFRELGPGDQPMWTPDISLRGAVFSHEGRCYRSGITYNAALERYLWWQVLPDRDGLGIYDAPEPWGPWTTVYYNETWDAAPGERGEFPAKWMSADGRTLFLVFSGDDAFSVREARLRTLP